VRRGERPPADALAERRRGYVASYQAGCPLVQRALRRAAGVALDPAVRRVRRQRVDPGQLQGAGADPGAVAVAVGQVAGPAAGDLVQKMTAGRAALEPLPAPA